MNTNSQMNNQDIKAAFSGLFDNRTEQDRRDDAAQLISFRYLSEVERLMGERGLTKRDLAKAIGTSASYITQLFRGDRLLNFGMLARLEAALDVTFIVEARQPAALPFVEYGYNDGQPTRPVRATHHSSWPFIGYSANPDTPYDYSDVSVETPTFLRQAA